MCRNRIYVTPDRIACCRETFPFVSKTLLNVSTVFVTRKSQPQSLYLWVKFVSVGRLNGGTIAWWAPFIFCVVTNIRYTAGVVRRNLELSHLVSYSSSNRRPLPEDEQFQLQNLRLHHYKDTAPKKPALYLFLFFLHIFYGEFFIKNVA